MESDAEGKKGKREIEREIKMGRDKERKRKRKERETEEGKDDGRVKKVGKKTILLKPGDVDVTVKVGDYTLGEEVVALWRDDGVKYKARIWEFHEDQGEEEGSYTVFFQLDGSIGDVGDKDLERVGGRGGEKGGEKVEKVEDVDENVMVKQ